MRLDVYFAIAMTIGLGSCASSGTMVTEQQAATFQKGVTTRTQVIAAVGVPDQSALNDDGTRVDIYFHIRAAANAASYIPIIGLFAGGATGTSNTATFIYRPDGVLKSTSTTAGKQDVATGLLNQH